MDKVDTGDPHEGTRVGAGAPSVGEGKIAAHRARDPISEVPRAMRLSTGPCVRWFRSSRLPLGAEGCAVCLSGMSRTGAPLAFTLRHRHCYQSLRPMGLLWRCSPARRSASSVRCLLSPRPGRTGRCTAPASRTGSAGGLERPGHRAASARPGDGGHHAPGEPASRAYPGDDGRTAHGARLTSGAPPRPAPSDGRVSHQGCGDARLPSRSASSARPQSDSPRRAVSHRPGNSRAERRFAAHWLRSRRKRSRVRFYTYRRCCPPVRGLRRPGRQRRGCPGQNAISTPAFERSLSFLSQRNRVTLCRSVWKSTAWTIWTATSSSTILSAA